MPADKGKQQSGPRDERQPDKEHGEGNYKASREYNQATREFMKSGQVEEAAKDAEPPTPEEREALRKAEEAGRSRSKEEDPQLYKGSRKSSNVR